MQGILHGTFTLVTWGYNTAGSFHIAVSKLSKLGVAQQALIWSSERQGIQEASAVYYIYVHIYDPNTDKPQKSNYYDIP